MSWRNLARFRREAPAFTETKLASAYKEVFGKRSEAVEIVLADLAAHTGFYLVEPPGCDMTQFQAGYNAGQRAAFGRLFLYLTLPDADLQALEQAAREEAQAL